MAHFGDLVGRKKMFTLSILLMALPTLAIGMLPTYATIGITAPLLLLLMRVLQGAAIGGEVPGAWVFVAEHVPRKRIGIACGTLTAGLTAGILLGSLVATVMNTTLGHQAILEGDGVYRSSWVEFSVCLPCTYAVGCRKLRSLKKCRRVKHWLKNCR